MNAERIAAPPSRRFEGKVALVTGVASGIGRATAIRLATEGAAVACLDITEKGLDETLDALRSLGATVLGAQCDVSDEALGRRRGRDRPLRSAASRWSPTWRGSAASTMRTTFRSPLGRR